MSIKQEDGMLSVNFYFNVFVIWMSMAGLCCFVPLFCTERGRARFSMINFSLFGNRSRNQSDLLDRQKIICAEMSEQIKEENARIFEALASLNEALEALERENAMLAHAAQPLGFTLEQRDNVIALYQLLSQGPEYPNDVTLQTLSEFNEEREVHQSRVMLLANEIFPELFNNLQIRADGHNNVNRGVRV